MDRFVFSFGVGVASFFTMLTVLLLGGIEPRQAIPIAVGFGAAIGVLAPK